MIDIDRSLRYFPLC